MTTIHYRTEFDEETAWMIDERFLGPAPEAEEPDSGTETCSCETGIERMINEGSVNGL